MFVPYLLLSSISAICSRYFKLVSLSLWVVTINSTWGTRNSIGNHFDWGRVYLSVNVSSVLKTGNLHVLRGNIITFNLYLLVAMELIHANSFICTSFFFLL